jgi:hypothetical protein
MVQSSTKTKTEVLIQAITQLALRKDCEMSLDDANSQVLEMDKLLSSESAKNDSLNKAKLAN